MIDYSSPDALQQAQSQRDQAMQRLMALAGARQNYVKKLNDQYQQQVNDQKQMNYEGDVNILGNAGSGAMQGAAYGPWGALAGGIMGLGSGALESYSAQKKAGKSTSEILWGKKDPGFWDIASGVGSVLTGGLSSEIGGALGHGGGLVGDVGSGGIEGTIDQARRGQFHKEFLMPNSRYSQAPLSGLAGMAAGGVANKMQPHAVTDQEQFNKDYQTYLNSGTAMSGAPGYSSVYTDTARQVAGPQSNSLYDQNLYKPSSSGLDPNDGKWAKFYPSYY